MPGRMVKWSVDEYEADKSRVRSTTLKLMVKSPQGPRAYYRAVVAPQPYVMTEDEIKKEESKKRNFVIGKLLHELLLEEKQNWFVTDARRGTKQWLDECDEHAPKVPIKSHEERQLLVMRDAVYRNVKCRSLLKAGGLSEQTVIWEEEIDGQVIECKCRLDWLTDSGIIVDLKSSMAEDRDKFNEQIWSYGYDFSAAYYGRGLLSVPEFEGHKVMFLHLVVNKSGWAYCWPLSPTWFRVGQEQVKAALRDLAECRNREAGLAVGVDREEAWPDRQEQSQLTMLEPKPWYIGQSNYNAGRPLSLDDEGGS